MMTDPIADMLTRIRNASMVHKKEVVVPYSKIKMNIAHILVREGYLDTAEELKDQPLSILIKLKYNQGEPAIQHLKKISKPGKRTYIKSTQIKRVLNGYGLAILSTPRGLLTNKEAHTAHVGGELICEIY
jgi:small subunit ribosomal protein S8